MSWHRATEQICRLLTTSRLEILYCYNIIFHVSVGGTNDGNEIPRSRRPSGPVGSPVAILGRLFGSTAHDPRQLGRTRRRDQGEVGNWLQLHHQRNPGSISEVKILQMPKVGKAMVSNLRAHYMAKPGYQGPDEFTYAFIGTDRFGGPMRLVFKRKVSVVPSL